MPNPVLIYFHYFPLTYLKVSHIQFKCISRFSTIVANDISSAIKPCQGSEIEWHYYLLSFGRFKRNGLFDVTFALNMPFECFVLGYG